MPDSISSLSSLQGTLSRLQSTLATSQQNNDPQAGLASLQSALGASLPGPMGANLQDAFASIQNGLTPQDSTPLSSDTTGNRTLTESDTLRIEDNGFQALTGGAVAPAFGEVISGFLGKVNAAQQNSDQLSEALALGEEVDVHKVMLALTDANNAMSMTLQVRSHVLKAYQDLMQIPL